MPIIQKLLSSYPDTPISLHASMAPWGATDNVHIAVVISAGDISVHMEAVSTLDMADQSRDALIDIALAKILPGGEAVDQQPIATPIQEAQALVRSSAPAESATEADAKAPVEGKLKPAKPTKVKASSEREDTPKPVEAESDTVSEEVDLEWALEVKVTPTADAPEQVRRLKGTSLRDISKSMPVMLDFLARKSAGPKPIISDECAKAVQAIVANRAKSKK